MNLRSTLLSLTFSCFITIGFAQIIHTESFAVILDTTKTIKGRVVPDFKVQNLKKTLIEFENTADISFKVGPNAITLANRFVLSKFGEDVILSGGFLYFEYRKATEHRLVLEPFAQLHWREARGLQLKYATGANLRYPIYRSGRMGVFAGLGPFYEYERWNYDGVADPLLIHIAAEQENRQLKLGSYLSLKWITENNFIIDFSTYYQNGFQNFFQSPRLASSSSIKYRFTEHLGVILQYQNIYDPDPIVPIDHLYNRIVFSIDVAF